MNDADRDCQGDLGIQPSLNLLNLLQLKLRHLHIVVHTSSVIVPIFQRWPLRIVVLLVVVDARQHQSRHS